MAAIIEEIPMRNLNDDRSVSIGLDAKWYCFAKSHPKITCIVSAIILTVILFFGIIIMINGSYDEPVNISKKDPITYCRSSSCKNIGAYVYESINRSVNPCENFYDFVCRRSFQYGKLDMIHEELHSTLENLLNQIPEKRMYLKKLKKYYESCVEDNTGFDDVELLLNEIGRWPLLSRETFSGEKEMEWTKVIHRMYSVGIPANYFFKIEFLADYKNSSRKVIFLSQPSFSFQKKYLMLGIDDEVMHALKESTMETINKLGVNSDMEQKIEQLLNFEMQLIKISHFQIEPLSNTWKLYEDISIGDLESKYPSVKWLDYINGILSPYTKIDASEKIYVEKVYIEKFHELLMNKKPSNQLLVNYAFFRAANYLVHDVQSRTERHRKHRKKSNLSDEESKFEECAIEINQDMYLATSSLFVRYLNIDAVVSELKIISENIRNAFLSIIQNVTWLNDKVKNKLAKKIRLMDLLIGYPRELLDHSKLDEYYQDLGMPSGNYMFDYFNFKRFKMKKDIESLTKPHDKKDWTQDYGNFAVLDAYCLMENVADISGGLLDPLFFNINLPHYMNYAMMGALLGHEISHSFGENWRLIDEYGNYQEGWWDAESSQIYLNKTKCIVEKYNNYGYPEYGLHVNGTLTLDENMSDINGLKVAYDAYIKAIENLPEEPKLPEFQSFSNKQMFWIIYGSTHCSFLTEESENEIRNTITMDSHSPERFRIIGSTSSLTEFTKDFNCKPTDFMNPPDKCNIWF